MTRRPRMTTRSWDSTRASCSNSSSSNCRRTATYRRTVTRQASTSLKIPVAKTYSRVAASKCRTQRHLLQSQAWMPHLCKWVECSQTYQTRSQETTSISLRTASARPTSTQELASGHSLEINLCTSLAKAWAVALQTSSLIKHQSLFKTTTCLKCSISMASYRTEVPLQAQKEGLKEDAQYLLTLYQATILVCYLISVKALSQPRRLIYRASLTT